MMTRREKLLIRPWQIRKYNNHKKKVVNAVPVVDFEAPPQRKHVIVKLKKLQKERERQMKIEEENFKLLQHLSSIMTKKRVDDFWQTKPPTFLKRVGIYNRTRQPTPIEVASGLATPEPCRKLTSKCFACAPYAGPKTKIPEERVPWEPPRKVLTCRRSCSPVVQATSDFDLPLIKNFRFEKKRKESVPQVEGTQKPVKNIQLPSVSCERKARAEKANQQIVLREGSFHIAFNFPSGADFKVVSSQSEKCLESNFCECKGFQTAQKNRQKILKKK